VVVEPIAGLSLGTSKASRLAALVRGMTLAPAAARAAAAAADVVHFPLTVPVPHAAHPTVVTLFDVLHHDVPALFSRAERTFRRVAYDRAAARATRVVTVSEHSRQRIAATCRIAPERIVAIHPGLDHARFTPQGDDSGIELPEPPWVYYPAAFWPHKNHAALLEALAQTSGVSLVLTGATFGREPELRALAAKHGVADRVRILGHVPFGSLPGLYRAATGVVFPSLAEGFGQPPLEAMACGTPAAASNTGAVAEACGGAALAFDPHDPRAIAAAITRLTQDDRLRDELRAAGLERAAGFSWDRAAAAHAEVYVSTARP
jgi:glycosyltransferase involved in cell wall biosynthesis